MIFKEEKIEPRFITTCPQQTRRLIFARKSSVFPQPEIVPEELPLKAIALELTTRGMVFERHCERAPKIHYS